VLLVLVVLELQTLTKLDKQEMLVEPQVLMALSINQEALVALVEIGLDIVEAQETLAQRLSLALEQQLLQQ
jgi:hypothetical protein